MRDLYKKYQWIFWGLVMIAVGLLNYLNSEGSWQNFSLIFMLTGVGIIGLQLYRKLTAGKYQEQAKTLPALEDRFVACLNNNWPTPLGPVTKVKAQQPVRIIARQQISFLKVYFNGKYLAELNRDQPIHFFLTQDLNVIHVEDENGKRSLPLFFKWVQPHPTEVEISVAANVQGEVEPMVILDDTLKSLNREAAKLISEN